MREQEIYIEAMKRHKPADRHRFLDEACGDNRALRERLDLLIRHSEEVESFLESSPVEYLAPPTIDQPITEKPGTQIGPYKLLQQIGEGGMGVVYMAEQKEPVKRRVALKIIKPGMDTRQVIARFEAERQALGDDGSSEHRQGAGCGADGIRPTLLRDGVSQWPASDQVLRRTASHAERTAGVVRTDLPGSPARSPERASSIAISSRRTSSSRCTTARRSPRSSTSALPKRPARR